MQRAGGRNAGRLVPGEIDMRHPANQIDGGVRAKAE
jgi:hypothetical protein